MSVACCRFCLHFVGRTFELDVEMHNKVVQHPLVLTMCVSHSPLRIHRTYHRG